MATLGTTCSWHCVGSKYAQWFLTMSWVLCGISRAQTYTALFGGWQQDGEWSPCEPYGHSSLGTQTVSMPIGCTPGRQKRTVMCMFGDGGCQGPDPATIRVCGLGDLCGYNLTSWSACAAPCGQQWQQTRTVTCIAPTFPNACPTAKPPESQACFGIVGCTWNLGEWGECYGCGLTGKQERSKSCLIAGACGGTPLVSRSCQDPICTTTTSTTITESASVTIRRWQPSEPEESIGWATSDWSWCFGACDTGHWMYRTRKVECVLSRCYGEPPREIEDCGVLRRATCTTTAEVTSTTTSMHSGETTSTMTTSVLMIAGTSTHVPALSLGRGDPDDDTGGDDFVVNRSPKDYECFVVLGEQVAQAACVPSSASNILCGPGCPCCKRRVLINSSTSDSQSASPADNSIVWISILVIVTTSIAIVTLSIFWCMYVKTSSTAVQKISDDVEKASPGSLYLPMNSRSGSRLLVRETKFEWRVRADEFPGKIGKGLAFRRSKCLDDVANSIDFGVDWGDVVRGFDEGDGWVRCQMKDCNYARAVWEEHMRQPSDMEIDHDAGHNCGSRGACNRKVSDIQDNSRKFSKLKASMSLSLDEEVGLHDTSLPHSPDDSKASTAATEDGAEQTSASSTPSMSRTSSKSYKVEGEDSFETSDVGSQAKRAASASVSKTASANRSAAPAAIELEYYSQSLHAWLPCVVMDRCSDGSIMIDLKPGKWITLKMQATCLRPFGSVAAADNPFASSAKEASSSSAVHARSPGIKRQVSRDQHSPPHSRSSSKGNSPMNSRNISYPFSPTHTTVSSSPKHGSSVTPTGDSNMFHTNLSTSSSPVSSSPKPCFPRVAAEVPVAQEEDLGGARTHERRKSSVRKQWHYRVRTSSSIHTKGTAMPPHAKAEPSSYNAPEPVFFSKSAPFGAVNTDQQKWSPSAATGSTEPEPSSKFSEANWAGEGESHLRFSAACGSSERGPSHGSVPDAEPPPSLMLVPDVLVGGSMAEQIARLDADLDTTLANNVEWRRKHFKALLLRWHPDKNSDAMGEADSATQANEVFKHLLARRAVYLDGG